MQRPIETQRMTPRMGERQETTGRERERTGGGGAALLNLMLNTLTMLTIEQVAQVAGQVHQLQIRKSGISQR